MAGLHSRSAAVCAAAALAFVLGGCVDNEGVVDQEGTIQPTTGVATPTEEPDSFESNDVKAKETDQIGGEIVEDPGMKVSYKWQGASYAPNGGTIITVAVTNHSDVTMPQDALGEPKLTYAGDQKANSKNAEEAGVEVVGLDLPLGKGATTNVFYAFDVDPGNLYDAKFQIGNVIFKGYLNN